MRHKTRIHTVRETQAKPHRVLKFWVGVGGCHRPEKSPQKRLTFKLNLKAIDRIGAGEGVFDTRKT